MSDIKYDSREFYRDFSITPDVAEEMLKRNKLNRSIHRTVVNRYAVMMTNGQWRDSNDSICFDRSGNLINGQHRLMAVIKSGVTIISDIKTGLDPDSIYNIDTAKSRNVKDAAAFIHPGDKLYGNAQVLSTIRQMRLIMLDVSMWEMDNEDSALKIKYIDEWKGIANFASHIVNISAKAPGVRRTEFMLAAMCANINGVSLEVISDFIRCCKNDVTGCEGYNTKVALDYRSEALMRGTMGRDHTVSDLRERMLKCEKILYAFANSKTRCRLEEPYPVTYLQLAELNSKWGA